LLRFILDLIVASLEQNRTILLKIEHFLGITEGY